MNSVIEGQIEYFDQTHPINVICINEFSSDAYVIDFKLKSELRDMKYFGIRSGDCSKSSKVYKSKHYKNK